MHVCVVGGIYGASEEYRTRHVFTPETILVEGLRCAGLSVTTKSHGEFVGSDEFDIVHVHHLGRGALHAASHRTRSSLVFTPHDGRMLANYEWTPHRRLAFRYVVHCCDAVVTLSPAETDFWGEVAGGVSKVELIPNGVSADVYAAWDQPRGSSHAPDTLLFVGQLIPLKGVDTLLRAVARVAAERPVELVLVYQNASLECEYRQLAQQLGIASRVRFIGALSPRELAVLYRKAAALILPSHAESLPSVITEALMSGTPIIASRVGGIPWQLGPFGSLVTPGRAEELSAAILSVLDDPSDSGARAEEMRAYALATFSTRAMAEAHIRLYEGLRKDRDRRSPGRAVVDFGVRTLTQLYWRRP